MHRIRSVNKQGSMSVNTPSNETMLAVASANSAEVAPAESGNNGGTERQVMLQTSDGELIELPPQLLDLSSTCKNLLKGKGKRSFQNSLGGTFSIEDNHVILKKEGRVLATLVKQTAEQAVILLHDVKAATLRKVLEYCWFHLSASEKERKAWNAQFVQVEQSQLCDLASASYYLDIKSLVNLTSRAIATQVSGKSTEEIRETLYISTDIYSPTFSTRHRLQKKITQKKQKQEKKSVSVSMTVDNRSVDELLQFIENSNGGQKKSTAQSAKVSSPPTPHLNGPSAKVAPESSLPAPIKGTTRAKSPPPERPSSPTSNSIVHTADASLKQPASQSSPLTINSTDLQLSNTNNLARSAEIDEALRRLEQVDPNDEAFWNAQEDEELGPTARAALDMEVEQFRQRLEAINTTSDSQRQKIPLPMEPAEFMKKMSWVDVC